MVWAPRFVLGQEVVFVFTNQFLAGFIIESIEKKGFSKGDGWLGQQRAGLVATAALWVGIQTSQKYKMGSIDVANTLQSAKKKKGKKGFSMRRDMIKESNSEK